MRLFLRTFIGVLSALFLLLTATYAGTITAVSFTGTPDNPTITIEGTGFGTVPDSTLVTSPLFLPDAGYDYGDSLYIQVFGPDFFSAGRGSISDTYDWIGLNNVSYTDNLISYQLGSAYTLLYYPYQYELKAGDYYEIVVGDYSYTGQVNYSDSPVPEPDNLLLLGSGLLGIAKMVRRQLA